MKIYTKTGDNGTTSLFSGQRLPKNNQFIDALGTVDEANSAIGLAIAHLKNVPDLNQVREQLEVIQHALFDLGAALATPRTCHQENKIERTYFGSEGIAQLEKWIDAMDSSLPPLKYFILPGGHPCGAALHLSRSIVRRAERSIIPLFQQSDVNEYVLMYLNRLSDYLFVVSRFVNHQLSVSEKIWQPLKTLESQ